MKIKDKLAEVNKILEDNDIDMVQSDIMIIHAIEENIDNLSDEELKSKLENSFNEILKDFGERDYETYGKKQENEETEDEENWEGFEE